MLQCYGSTLLENYLKINVKLKTVNKAPRTERLSRIQSRKFLSLQGTKVHPYHNEAHHCTTSGNSIQLISSSQPIPTITILTSTFQLCWCCPAGISSPFLSKVCMKWLFFGDASKSVITEHTTKGKCFKACRLFVSCDTESTAVVMFDQMKHAVMTTDDKLAEMFEEVVVVACFVGYFKTTWEEMRTILRATPTLVSLHSALHSLLEFQTIIIKHKELQ